MRFLLILCIVACATSAVAQEPRPRHAVSGEDLSLVVAGGVSLGSYQAGFLYYYIEYLKLVGARLASTSGASAGSINATIAAAASCREPELDPTSSIFWRVWIPVTFDELLPKDLSSVTPLGLFRRRPLEAAAVTLHEYAAAEDGWRVGRCRVPVGVVATRLTPESASIGNGASLTAMKATESFSFAFDTRVPGHFDHVRCEPSQAADAQASPQNGSSVNEQPSEPACGWLRHPGSRVDRPSFGDIRDLLFASASFPLAFEPMALTSHDHEDQVSTELYIDGGVFDNVPILLSRQLASPESRIVVLDSDATPWKRKVEPAKTHDSLASAVGSVVSGFIGTARSQRLLQVAEQDALVRMPERRAMLSSDYLFAFSGFLDRRFREFDFYLGMLDARAFIASQAGGNAPVQEPQIQSRVFECFKQLENLSIDLRQVPSLESSWRACELPGTPRDADGSQQMSPEAAALRQMIELFRASMDSQQFASSATEPSELEVFKHFLMVLDESRFTFFIHGHEVAAKNLLYSLRQIVGVAAERMIQGQPEYRAILDFAADAALNEALLHMPPSFYWSLGVHLNRGADADLSWSLGTTRRQRLGLGVRLRQFSLLSEPQSAKLTANLVYVASIYQSANFGVELGAETGLGYRFHGSNRRENGSIPPEDRRGLRQPLAGTLGVAWYERLYLRGDARVYSRLSKHWPKDFRNLEVGFAAGWRFH